MASQAHMSGRHAKDEALKKSGSSLTPLAKIDNMMDDEISGVESYASSGVESYEDDASSGVESYEDDASSGVESYEVSSTDLEWYKSGGTWRIAPLLQTKKANATTLKHIFKQRDVKVRIKWSRGECKWVVRDRWA